MKGKGGNDDDEFESRPIIPPFFLSAPILGQALGGEVIAGAQEGGDVDVEGGVDSGAGEEHADGADALEDGVGGGPGVLQKVEADLAVPQRHVRVHDLRPERDLRRRQRIRRRHFDAEKPAAFCFGLKYHPLLVDARMCYRSN